MSSAADIKRLNTVLAKVLDGMKPPEDVTVTEWAEKHRKLSSESSAEVGTWRTSRTPYLREPMNAFCDPKIHHLVMVAASQVGKSELMNNCMRTLAFWTRVQPVRFLTMLTARGR